MWCYKICSCLEYLHIYGKAVFTILWNYADSAKKFGLGHIFLFVGLCYTMGEFQSAAIGNKNKNKNYKRHFYQS